MNPELKQQVLANRKREDDHIQNGTTTDDYINGASFRYLSIAGAQKVCYESSVESPHVVVPYVMEGEMYVDYLDAGSSVKLSQHHNRFIYRPEYHIKVSYEAKNRFSGMRLLLDESFLARYQSLIENTLPTLAESIHSNQAFVSPSSCSFTSINEWQVLKDIRNCRLTGAMRDLYLESKVGELLALRFSNMMNEPAKRERRLKETDYQKIRNVRAFLEQSFCQKHSLDSLAREFGLNTFKLKTGFKELYQIPVYQLILSLRMSKARQLLEDGMNVNEVSQELGYAQANYFSMAFKKHYGFTPSQLKK